MKSTSWMLFVPSLLAELLTWAAIPLGYDASAGQGQDSSDTPRIGKAEVVIIICQTIGTGTPIGSAPFNVTVAGVSHSSEGPAVQVGADCAQAVASVLSAGFRIRDVEVLPVTGLIYTLVDR